VISGKLDPVLSSSHSYDFPFKGIYCAIVYCRVSRMFLYYIFVNPLFIYLFELKVLWM